VRGLGLSQAGVNSGCEGTEVRVVLGVQALLFDKLPQPLDEVEVGRIRGQEQQLDPQLLCHGLYERTALIAGIVQHHGDRHAQGERGQAMEELADTLGVDVGGVGDRDDFMGQGVEGA